jgi:hypothetical protein
LHIIQGFPFISPNWGPYISNKQPLQILAQNFYTRFLSRALPEGKKVALNYRFYVYVQKKEKLLLKIMFIYSIL